MHHIKIEIFHLGSLAGVGLGRVGCVDSATPLMVLGF